MSRGDRKKRQDKEKKEKKYYDTPGSIKQERDEQQWEDLLDSGKDKYMISDIMSDASFYDVMKEITLTYIMADFHKQSLIQQWISMILMVKKRAKAEARLDQLNDNTMNSCVAGAHLRWV